MTVYGNNYQMMYTDDNHTGLGGSMPLPNESKT